MEFSHLFQPIKINQMLMQNRIVMTAMQLGMAAENGEITPQLINFYQERAKGEVGLIIIGECFTSEEGKGFVHEIGMHNDKMIPAARTLVQAVHKHGVKICAQINHSGRYAPSRVTGIQPWAPSSIASRLTGEEPRALTKKKIDDIIIEFAQSAARIKAAGFDAVEICGSGGALISEFFSTLTNIREDDYGGSLKNRSRFAIEVVKAVRKEVGPEFPILFRLSGHQLMPGGYDLEDSKQIAIWLVKAGVDCLNVSGGWEESVVPQLSVDVPKGAYTFLAKGIKEQVDVPVIGCLRINDPLLAEKILREGNADMTAMTRAMIADPEMPVKAKKGRLKEIRKCIGCNQECLDKIFPPLNGPAGCLVNYQAGREQETKIKPAQKKKKVCIIGGGLAGLESARILALRGHKVLLFEEKDKFGGQALISAKAPSRQDFMSLIEYYEWQIHILGVKTFLNTKVTAEMIVDCKPDAVVLATGALPLQPSVDGVNLPHVVKAWDVIAGKAKIGKQVLIVGGGSVGVETALSVAQHGTVNAETAVFLAQWGVLSAKKAINLTLAGKSPVVIETKSKIATDIGPSRRWVIMQRLKAHNVILLKNAELKKIVAEGALVEIGTGETKLFPADTVIMATGSKSYNELQNELEKKIPEVYVIGDCKSPRKMSDAIKEGFEVGLKI